MFFIDFEYLENEKTRSKYINIINNSHRDIILLTDDKNNIKKAYSYGLRVMILDAIPKSVEAIDNVLKQITENHAFYHHKSGTIHPLTWDTLTLFNENGYDIKDPYYDVYYKVITNLDVPGWIKKY